MLRWLSLQVDEALIRSMADNQMASLENLILAQRAAQLKMAQYLRDAEARHAKVGHARSRKLAYTSYPARITTVPPLLRRAIAVRSS